MNTLWPWVTLALLGAYHGINPGMGWLFAVSLGLQERSRAAVMRAFTPIAIGHFASIAIVVAVVAALRPAVSPELLRYGGGGILIAFGIYKLVAPMSHPRWVGMRVGPRQLALWSFLMATAHGAGLMVVPIVLKMEVKPATAIATASASALPIQSASLSKVSPAVCVCQTEVGSAGALPTGGSDRAPAASLPSCHAQVSRMAQSEAGIFPALAGVCLHTLAMFAVMAGIALLVYDRIGLKILRTAWVNLDLVWSIALIGAGIVTMAL